MLTDQPAPILTPLQIAGHCIQIHLVRSRSQFEDDGSSLS
jgi:hypothetical protein